MRKTKPLICTTTGVFFNSRVSAAAHYKFSPTAFYDYFKGKQQHAGRDLDGTKLEWEECNLTAEGLMITSLLTKKILELEKLVHAAIREQSAQIDDIDDILEKYRIAIAELRIVGSIDVRCVDYELLSNSEKVTNNSEKIGRLHPDKRTLSGCPWWKRLYYWIHNG